MLTQARLQELMIYDPLTGRFKWRYRRPGVRDSLEAGWIHEASGYHKIEIDRHCYPASHLAFLYMTGHLPILSVDHANRNRGDNRWCNIREANYNQQAANKDKNKRNTSGYKGVSKRSHRYSASVQSDFKRIWLGMFSTAEDANDAYIAASKRLHKEFCYAT